MDVVVLNEESNMPDREKQFLSGKKHYATYTTCTTYTTCRRCRVTMHFIICLLLLFFCQYIYSFTSTYGLLAYYAYISY
jgi:hypothetical protein